MTGHKQQGVVVLLVPGKKYSKIRVLGLYGRSDNRRDLTIYFLIPAFEYFLPGTSIWPVVRADFQTPGPVSSSQPCFLSLKYHSPVCNSCWTGGSTRKRGPRRSAPCSPSSSYFADEAFAWIPLPYLGLPHLQPSPGMNDCPSMVDCSG